MAEPPVDGVDPLPSVLDDLSYWVDRSNTQGKPVSHLELGSDVVEAAGREALDVWAAGRNLTWHEVGTL